MKAMVCTRYGGPEVLELRHLPLPEPRADQIRVRIHATSVGYGDLIARNFGAIRPRNFNMPFLFWLLSKLAFGLRKPRVAVLGAEFSGVVDLVGQDVSEFTRSDEVFGFLGSSMGADAEYACMSAQGCVAKKPRNVSFEEAATLPYGAAVALHLLRKAQPKPGEKALVIGASGSIGSAAVQLLVRHFDASVIGVCGTASQTQVIGLGASRAIDYTKGDFTLDEARYDVIFDVLGRCSWRKCRRLLNDGGRYVRASFKSRELLQMLWTSATRSRRRVICALAPTDQAALLSVKELVEADQLGPNVDRVFGLDELGEAHRYAESQEKHGAVVVRVS